MLQFRLVKQPYFSAGTIDEAALSFREALQAESAREKLVFSPKIAALLVLDMQRYFLDPASHAFVPSAPAILPRIQALIRAFRRHERPVYFTQHLNTPADAGMMAVWWHDLLQPGDPRAGLTPELDPAGAVVLPKTQYDAFFQTPLEGHLRELGVRQVVICGVMTHLCCETTTRSAFMRGFEVFFPIDASATYNRDFHLASLRNLAHGFACLPTVRELLDEMEETDEV